MKTNNPRLRSVLSFVIASVAVRETTPVIRAQGDVTQPGDPVVLVNGVNDGDPDAWPPSATERVDHAIDNLGQKYLNFHDLGSGLAVQPRAGPTIVTGLRLYTANDEESRDPASFLLEGSRNGFPGPWSQIASGPLSLPGGRNPGGGVPLGGQFQTVNFTNPTRYAAYRLTFPTLKNAAVANSMQIGEIELPGSVALPGAPPNGPGNALDFDGGDDHLRASPAALPAGNSPYTIEAWIRPDSMHVGAIAAWGNLGFNNQVNAFVLTTGGLVNYWWANDLTAPTPGLAGAWHHVAATFNGTTRQILLDGAVIASDTPVGHNASPNNFRIGLANTGQYFDGLMDEVRIWNVGRTAAQVQATMGRQLFGDEPGLVACYRFDESGGQTALDATGNLNNTATLINGPTWVTLAQLSTGIAPFAPTVKTLAASAVSDTTATLNGTALSQSSTAGQMYFEWGTDGSFGNVTPSLALFPDGQLMTWSHPLTGLVPDMTYYYRSVAANENGTSYGETFSTDRIPPVVVSFAATMEFNKFRVTFSEPVDEVFAEDRFNYSFQPWHPADVVEALRGPDGRTVTLVTDSAFSEDTEVRVEIREVRDLAGNSMTARQILARTFKFTPGLLRFETYDTGGGNEVTALTNHHSFPDHPRERFYMPAFDTRTVYPDDSHEGFGARITGIFVPPVSGNYIFYLRSDDASELWFNPAGIEMAGAVKITEETTCCNPFPAHRSAPQALSVGQRYFIMALYKEGSGGDHCQVAATLEGTPGDPALLLPITAGSLGIYADAVGAVVTITQQPTDQEFIILPPPAPASVTFRVGATASITGVVDQPIVYQWQRREPGQTAFIDVPGAFSANYTFSPTGADNGACFRALLAIPGAAATSSVACLTVERRVSVTTIDDSGAGSLRQVIQDSASGDTIVFAPELAGVIRLTSGECLIDKSLRIAGPGAARMTISGAHSSRVFHIGTAGNVGIAGLTITEGLVAGVNGSGPEVDGSPARGGCIFNAGRLTLQDCAISSNRVQGGRGGDGRVGSGGSVTPGNGGWAGGGAIYNMGHLTLVRCTLSGNVARGGDGGGGGRNEVFTVFGNGGAGMRGYGGAIWNEGAVARLENCTLADNHARGGDGGSPWPFSDATAGRGGDGVGGAFVGVFELDSCTIARNSADGGGSPDSGLVGLGIAGGAGSAFVWSTAHNCIIALNTVSGSSRSSAPDIGDVGLVDSGFVTPWTSRGWNLIGVSYGSSGWTATDLTGSAATPLDPVLGPLQDHGGATPTMALLSGSPAIGHGHSSGLTTDQRGFPRLGIPDIGAYETGTTTNYNAWIWEMLPASGIASQHEASFDFDSDGQSNQSEWLALTNPAGSADMLRPVSTRNGANFLLTFPTAIGRSYILRQSDTLGPASWINAPGIAPLTGNGQTHTFILPIAPARRYYQVVPSVPGG